MYKIYNINKLLFLISYRSSKETRLYIDVRETQWPIVYSSEYNISFLGLEKLHPFDSGKWGRIIEFLKGLLKLDVLNLIIKR